MVSSMTYTSAVVSSLAVCEREVPEAGASHGAGQTGRARRGRGGRHRQYCPRPAARLCVLLMTVRPARRRIISKIAEIRRPGTKSLALLLNIISVGNPSLDCRKIVPQSQTCRVST